MLTAGAFHFIPPGCFFTCIVTVLETLAWLFGDARKAQMLLFSSAAVLVFKQEGSQNLSSLHIKCSVPLKTHICVLLLVCLPHCVITPR